MPYNKGNKETILSKPLKKNSNAEKKNQQGDCTGLCTVCGGTFPLSILQYHTNQCLVRRSKDVSQIPTESVSPTNSAFEPQYGEDYKMQDLPKIDINKNANQNDQLTPQEKLRSDLNQQILEKKQRDFAQVEYDKANSEKAKQYDFFSAFGKPGGGAPVRNGNNEIITNIKKLDNVRSNVQKDIPLDDYSGRSSLEKNRNRNLSSQLQLGESPSQDHYLHTPKGVSSVPVKLNDIKHPPSFPPNNIPSPNVFENMNNNRGNFNNNNYNNNNSGNLSSENQRLRSENDDLKTMVIGLKQIISNYKMKYGDL